MLSQCPRTADTAPPSGTAVGMLLLLPVALAVEMQRQQERKPCVCFHSVRGPRTLHHTVKRRW